MPTDTRGPDFHYPHGSVPGGCHPGPLADCPATECTRQRDEQPETAAPASDNTLQKRIADVLDRLHETGAVYALEGHERDRIAAALLPLFIEEREAAYRDAAAVADNAASVYAQRGDTATAGAVFAVMERLTAKATGCSWPPCDDDETCAGHDHAGAGHPGEGA